MNLTDEQLDALAERLAEASFENGASWITVAREAARWAAEQQGEVVWESDCDDGWTVIPSGVHGAIDFEYAGYEVRAIRVIATTTEEWV